MCVAGVGVGDNGLKSSSPVIRNSGGCMDGCVLCVMFVCLSETVKGGSGGRCVLCAMSVYQKQWWL